MPNTSASTNYIYRMGTAPNTRAAVSQKNKIFGYAVGAAGFQQLGVISTFGFDESRDVQPIRGVGFGDFIAEMVPGNTEPMSVSLTKTLLYTTNLFQVLGYKGGVDGLVRSLRHHRWPFDIKQELVFSELSAREDAIGSTVEASGPYGPAEPIVSPRALLTFYEGCWFSSYAAEFSSDSAIVSENSTVLVTDVIDAASQYGEYIDSGLAPISANGGPGNGFSRRFQAVGNDAA